MLKSSSASLAVLAGVLFLSAATHADVMTSADGKYKVGVTEFGNLYDPAADIGFRRIDGTTFFDPIAPLTTGVSREAWSVYSEWSTGNAFGYVDRRIGGKTTPTSAVGLSVLDGDLSPDSKLSTLLKPGATSYLQVDQTFTLVNNNLLQIEVQITNPYQLGIDQHVYYKRLVDWDLYSSNGGSDKVELGDRDNPPVLSYTFSDQEAMDVPGSFVNPLLMGYGQARGAGFQLDLGTLKPGYAAHFYVFHAISPEGGNVGQLLQQVRNAGANALQITGEARPGGDIGRSAALGVSQVNIVPLPSAAWAGMALMGLVAVGHWYRRRAA